MTLNNYNKMMNEIRLSEEMKNQIVENILKEDIQPKKNRIMWKPILGILCILVVALLLLPRTTQPTYQATQSEPALAESTLKEEAVYESTTATGLDMHLTICPFEVIEMKREGNTIDYIGEKNSLHYEGKEYLESILSSKESYEFEVLEEYKSVQWKKESNVYTITFQNNLTEEEWNLFLTNIGEK